jgi:ActR/RegA family two-component response regulator
MTAAAAPKVPRLLLIDSNVFFAKRLGDALKHEGFEVAHNTQSAFALTSLEWDTPVAILCSTSLREMGAFEWRCEDGAHTDHCDGRWR